MIQIAKDLITEILKDYGLKQIFYDDDAFERGKVNPSAIILANKEEIKELRKKVGIWTDISTGKKYLRTQKYERILPIEVNIFHKTEEDADKIVCHLLAQLPKGTEDNDNHIFIEPVQIDWPPDQKSRALAVVIIKFKGGIYYDKELATYTNIKLNT